MAIAFDSANVSSKDTTNQITLPHTITGSQPFLVVTVGFRYSATITSVTWNGTTMTDLFGGSIDSSNGQSQSFYLAAPATGSHDVVVNSSGSQTNGCIAQSISYTGVHQSAPIGATNTSATNTTSYTISVTSTVANSMLLDSIVTSNTTNANLTFTPGGSQTERGVGLNVNLKTFCLHNAEHQTTTTGSYTDTWTWGGTSQDQSRGIFEILPPASATTNASFLLNFI